jgi:hypothetical protein
MEIYARYRIGDGSVVSGLWLKGWLMSFHTDSSLGQTVTRGPASFMPWPVNESQCQQNLKRPYALFVSVDARKRQGGGRP